MVVPENKSVEIAGQTITLTDKDFVQAVKFNLICRKILDEKIQAKGIKQPVFYRHRLNCLYKYLQNSIRYD